MFTVCGWHIMFAYAINVQGAVIGVVWVNKFAQRDLQWWDFGYSIQPACLLQKTLIGIDQLGCCTSDARIVDEGAYVV